jgi:two-component system, sensor histidine kinase and response regulator
VALALASPASNLYFLCFLPVLWIAMQHGLLRATVAVAVTNVLAATGIALFRPEAPIQHLQLFMIALAVTGLLVGALVAERRATIGRMKAASARLRSFVAELSRLGESEEIIVDIAARDSLSYHLQTLESVQRLLARTAKQLRSLNAEKDRLLAILSHDLRSPLSGIQGLAEVMIDDVSTRDPALSQMLGSIRDAARQSHRLLENLLRWAQLQTGDTTPDKTRIDLGRMVRTAIALADSGALRKSIQIDVALPHPLEAEGDPEMTGTVIRNLLSNAIKFTPQGGQVTISGRYTAAGVEVIVRDTGVGMSDRQVHEVFDIGSKSSTPGTAGETGTGLGLILCRELAEAQSGDLTIESVQGNGTTVTFRLPLLLLEDDAEHAVPPELQIVS